MARDFFGNTPAIPRVVRRICEEVKAGNLSKVSLIGRKSSDGYKIGALKIERMLTQNQILEDILFDLFPNSMYYC